MKQLLYILAIFATFTVAAQQTPAASTTDAFTITGAKIHVGNGEILDNVKVIIQDDKIAYIGAPGAIADRGEVINAVGQHIYPGFIAPNTTLGLAEIDAVRATRDDDEVGAMNPHIRSLIAYNTESKVIETMRPNGVLMAQITPRGGLISGTSSIVQLDAWNWEDAVLKEDDGIHINWPKTFLHSDNWWDGEHAVFKTNKKYAKKVEQLDDYFSQSQIYLSGTDTNHLPFEAMRGLFKGSKQLFIHVNEERGIIDAINFSKKYGIAHIVIVGGFEANYVTDVLKENNIPVLLKRIHARPLSDDADYDSVYRLAHQLTEAGVLVGLDTSGSMERMQTRNLPFLAGTCAAYGMPKNEALKLITSNTAKILGIYEKYGTIERGKNATLFVSDGDALDMRSNKVTSAFIDGRKISLETNQTKLYKRYSDKYHKSGYIKQNSDSPSWRSIAINRNKDVIIKSGYSPNNELKNPLFYKQKPEEKKKKRRKWSLFKSRKKKKEEERSKIDAAKEKAKKEEEKKKKRSWEYIIRNTDRDKKDSDGSTSE